MPVTLTEGRARLIASVTPLTWRQVINLAYQASEECLIDFADWLTWGQVEEVGEWLWGYWVDNAAGDDLGWSANLSALGSRVGDFPAPVIARSVGQRPPLAGASWRDWRWRAGCASLARSTSAPSARECSANDAD